MKKLQSSIFIIVIMLLSSPMIFGQDIEKLKKEAYDYFSYEDYQEALPLLMKIEEIDPTDPQVNYEIGICYMNSHHQDKALKYFKKAQELGYKKERVAEFYLNEEIQKWVSDDLDFNLGRAYHLHHEFDSAIKSYGQYKEKLKALKHHNKHHNNAHILDKFIVECQHGKELIKTPINVIIEPIKGKINSIYPEYVPVVSADETMMIFTSRRPNTTGGEKDPFDENHYIEDIYISYKDSLGEWSEPTHISENINTNEHDACIGLSPDAQKLFIYKNDHHNTGNIYVSTLKGDDWSVPEKMQEGINGKHSWEGSASISADEKWLFFTSNREEGKGGKDIYWSKKLPNGKWGVPINMGDSVNTQYDEDSPFIHADGKTLYFSSKGWNSMGGYDIFKTVYDEVSNTWSSPINIGYPINTADEDIFFVFTADGKRAYFSSHHEDSKGEQDIYVMHRNEEQESSLIVLKGVVTSTDKNIPVNSLITIINNDNGETVGVYNSNSTTGKYLIVLKPGHNYGISIDNDDYLPYSDNVNLPDIGEFYEEKKNIKLQPIEPGTVLVLNNVFFEYDESKLKSASFHELDKYVDYLKSKTHLYVEIAGHTDNKGSDAYNLKLSQERANSVVDYLVSKGIDKKRLVAVGYGEREPVEKNELANGKDNPQGRKKNRRTELIIHKSIEDGTGWQKHYKKK